MDENEEFEFRLRAEQEAAMTAPPAPAAAVTPPSEPGFMSKAAARVGEAFAMPWRATAGIRDTVAAPFELAAEGATSLAGKAVSGLAGIAGANPEEMRGVQDSMTYQPRTQMAGTIKDVVGGATKAVSKITKPVDDYVANLPAGPRTAIESAEEAATDLLGLVPVGGSAGRVARTAAEDAVSGAARATTADPLQTVRAAGYKVRPSDVKVLQPGQKTPGTFRESLQEPAKLRNDITLENQANTTRLAAEDLGIPDKKALMEKDYNDLKQPHFQVYENAAKAANLTPSTEYAYALKSAQERAGLKGNASVTETISALRRNARKRARSEDIKANKEGEADQLAADELESALETQLSAQGDKKLFDDYVSSRRSLAKIHDYETATRGGQVNAHALRRIDKKSQGRLTGNAKVIADAAEYVGDVTGRPRTGERSSVKAESVTGAVRNAVGGLVSKLPGMDVARPGFQNKFGREAVTDAEKQSLRDYGKRAPRTEAPPTPRPQTGTGDVEFTPTAGVVPSRSLASELELAPEPVANPQQLPPRPDFLTADTPPPVRGDIDFQPSPELLNALAGELGLVDNAVAPSLDNVIEWTPPSMAPQMAGNEALALGLPDNLIAQLGLSVDTPQPRDFSRPLGERTIEAPYMEDFAPLAPSPGRVGKPKQPKKAKK